LIMAIGIELQAGIETETRAALETGSVAWCC
jgi:hypothetical protein